MKRFTDTEKWRDPWFRNLTSPAKQLWGYLLDNCDKIGLVQIDLRLASTDCGQRINETHLTELGNRIEDFGNGKHLIPKFIHFQYGTLTEACYPHRSIIELVRIHGLVLDGVNYHPPKVNESRVVTTLVTRVQDCTKQEKNGKGGDARGGFKKPELPEAELYAAKLALPPSEVSKFFDYYESNGWRVGKAAMRDWQASMRNWNRNYRSNSFPTNHTRPTGGNF